MELYFIRDGIKVNPKFGYKMNSRFIVYISYITVWRLIITY
jgi:hypothetical protein